MAPVMLGAMQSMEWMRVGRQQRTSFDIVPSCPFEVVCVMIQNQVTQMVHCNQAHDRLDTNRDARGHARARLIHHMINASPNVHEIHLVGRATRAA